MDFFALLTDPKVLLIIAVLALLIALAVYTWRQSGHIEELQSKNTRILEQVKHGVLLEDNGGSTPTARLRHDMASNMSEETFQGGHTPEEEHGDEENNEWADDDCSDEEHTAYIKELIRINDNKRSNKDEFYIKTQQQSGHHGPVYDSGEEDVIFDTYADSDDEVSDTDMVALAARELAEAQKLGIKILNVAPVFTSNTPPAPPVPQVVPVLPVDNLTVKPQPLDTPKKKKEVKAKAAAKPPTVKEEVTTVKEAVVPAVKEAVVPEEVKDVPEVKEEVVAPEVKEAAKPEPTVAAKIKPVIGKKQQSVKA